MSTFHPVVKRLVFSEKSGAMSNMLYAVDRVILYVLDIGFAHLHILLLNLNPYADGVEI